MAKAWARSCASSVARKLDIAASAQLNPDVDSLDRLELVVLGDVTRHRSAAGKDRRALRKQITADRSMWIAVRAYGGEQAPHNMTIAHSAPIYVVVDDEPTWNARWRRDHRRAARAVCSGC